MRPVAPRSSRPDGSSPLAAPKPLLARRLRPVASREVIDRTQGRSTTAWLMARTVPRRPGAAPGVRTREFTLWLDAGRRWHEVGFVRVTTVAGARARAAGWAGLRAVAAWSDAAMPLGLLFQFAPHDRRISAIPDDATAAVLDEIQVHRRIGGQAIAHWLAQTTTAACADLAAGDPIVLQAQSLPSRYDAAPDADLPDAIWAAQQVALCREYGRWGLQAVRQAPRASRGTPRPEDGVVFWAPAGRRETGRLPARGTDRPAGRRRQAAKAGEVAHAA